MRKARVLINNSEAGTLIEVNFRKKYRFEYLSGYSGMPVSLTMSVKNRIYEFDTFPPFFDGLLPEGFQLEGLLKFGKIDRSDQFSQLIAIGADMVGNVTIEEIPS